MELGVPKSLEIASLKQEAIIGAIGDVARLRMGDARGRVSISPEATAAYIPRADDENAVLAIKGIASDLLAQVGLPPEDISPEEIRQSLDFFNSNNS